MPSGRPPKRAQPTGDGIGSPARPASRFVDRHLGHPPAGRVGGRADVGDDGQMRRPEQRVEAGQRLGIGYVEAGAGDPAGLEAAPQRLRIDDLTAGGVDQDRALLHRHQRPLVDQPAGLRRQRAMEADDVGFGEQLVELDPAGTGRAAAAQDPHPEALAATSHGLADQAGADDAQGRAVDVAAEPARRLPGPPLTLADRVRRLDDLSGDRQDQREGEVGGRLGEHPGRVADRDPLRRWHGRRRCCRFRRRSWRSPAASGRRRSARRRSHR